MTQSTPQAPPSQPHNTTAAAAAATTTGAVGIYDLFFDLPHPAASAACERARVIESPAGFVAVPSIGELFEPSNVSRIARFAFPEFDDQKHEQSHSFRLTKQNNGQSQRHAHLDPPQNGSSGSGGGGSANLNRYDVYLQSFTSQQHTIALQLSDGTRIHGHVRRYLPTHVDAKVRSDVGRRGSRAMVLLTRATGGERFYSSVLKTVETIMAAADTVSSDLYNDETPARTFLHTLYNRHAKLCSDQFFTSTMMMGGGGAPNINDGTLAEVSGNSGGTDSKSVNSSTMASAGSAATTVGISNSTLSSQLTASDMARLFVEKTGNFFKITLPMIEFGSFSSSSNTPVSFESNRLAIAGDYIRFQLPPSLQPCYENLGPYSMMEDMYSPILPLLRCIGAPHLLRLLSALLCERKIIMVSKSTSRLSICVRAASSLLSQGLLVWRHIHIPVLPPHLLNYILAQQPYIIGLLETHASNLDTIPGLVNVLCVYLDRNELRTYNMDDPDFIIPDLLKQTKKKNNAKTKSGGTSSSSSFETMFSISELLAKDLDEILKADRRMWGYDEKNKDKHGGAGNSTTSASGQGEGMDGGVGDSASEQDNASSAASQRQSFLKRFLSSRSMRSNMSSASIMTADPSNTSAAALAVSDPHLSHLTHEERRHSPDAAAFFGKIMRASRQYPKQNENAENEQNDGMGEGQSFDDNSVTSTSQDYSNHGNQQQSSVNYYAPSSSSQQCEIGSACSTIEPCSTCENERGEEEIRAALVSFYLYTYGDMGMYLSESPQDGTLWLDRRKFLLRKKQMGDKEDTPMFTVLRLFSGSAMFEHFVRGRIAELEQTRSERMRIMPHHIPLFAMCEKFMIVNRLHFSIGTIRRVVSKTIVSCPQHNIVEATERARAIALALTSNQSYEGNVTAALAELVNDCREVDSALCHVMAVIWSRLGETRTNLWKRPLLALHLLKNLLLHGPITAVMEANDGIDKIRALRNYVNSKHSDSIREVCTAANHVYGLLIDRTCLFLRRKRVACGRAMPTALKVQMKLRWSDYLVRRLPVTVNFQHIHLLLRPNESYTLPTRSHRSNKSPFAPIVNGQNDKLSIGNQSSIPMISSPNNSNLENEENGVKGGGAQVDYDGGNCSEGEESDTLYNGDKFDHNKKEPSTQEQTPYIPNGNALDYKGKEPNITGNESYHSEAEPDVQINDSNFNGDNIFGNDSDYEEDESNMQRNEDNFKNEKQDSDTPEDDSDFDENIFGDDSDHEEQLSDAKGSDPHHSKRVSDMEEINSHHSERVSNVPRNVDFDSSTEVTMDDEEEIGVEEKEQEWVEQESYCEDSEENHDDESETEDMMDMLAFFNSTIEPETSSPAPEQGYGETGVHDSTRLYSPMTESSSGSISEIELKLNRKDPVDIDESLKNIVPEETDQVSLGEDTSQMDSQEWNDSQQIDIEKLHMTEINGSCDPAVTSSTNE